MKFLKLPIALAVAATMSTGFAYANGDGDGGHGRDRGDSVDIDKDIDVDIDVKHRGFVQTLGLVLVDSTATAISDVNQKSMRNTVNNGFDTRNNATATGDALNGATGNIGLNVAAGDDNMQQNSTSISRIVSPDSVGVSVQAGYDVANHRESAASDVQHHDDATTRNNDWSIQGSAVHNDSHSVDVDITNGRYDHAQNEQSSSKTNIDANVVGGISHLSGAKSHSRKELETAEGEIGRYGDHADSGEAQHDQTVGFVSGERANLQAGQGTTTVVTTTPGEGGGDPTESTVTTSSPSTYTSEDTTNTHSETTIGADFSSSYSESEDNHFDVSGDANHDDSYSANNTRDTSRSHSSSYDYTEFARLDANLVFGAALDAETFSKQSAYGNRTNNNGVVNRARLNGNVGQNASGNIGINITSGSTNAQANQLAIAAGTDAVSALATAASSQYVGGNTTDNAPDAVIETSFSLISLSQRGSASGAYSGTSDQNGDVYPDTWDGNVHPEGGQTGHFDLDSVAQGAQGADGVGGAGCGTGNSNGGALCFDEKGTLSLSGIRLSGGSVTFSRRYLGHTNTASISGNALMGASGNIGVNVSAGSNNLQGNALAIASVRQSGMTPPPGGGGGEAGQ